MPHLLDAKQGDHLQQTSYNRSLDHHHHNVTQSHHIQIYHYQVNSPEVGIGGSVGGSKAGGRLRMRCKNIKHLKEHSHWVFYMPYFGIFQHQGSKIAHYSVLQSLAIVKNFTIVLQCHPKCIMALQHNCNHLYFILFSKPTALFICSHPLSFSLSPKLINAKPLSLLRCFSSLLTFVASLLAEQISVFYCVMVLVGLWVLLFGGVGWLRRWKV